MAEANSASTTEVNESAAKSAESVGKLVDDAILSAKNASGSIHTAAVACATHAALFGDVSLCDRLLKGLEGTNVFVGGIRAWFTEHTPIRWTNDKDGKPIFPGKLLPKDSKERQRMNEAFPEAIGEGGKGFGLEKATETAPQDLAHVKRGANREPKQLTLAAVITDLKTFKEKEIARIKRAVENNLIAPGEDSQAMIDLVNATKIDVPVMVFTNHVPPSMEGQAIASPPAVETEEPRAPGRRDRAAEDRPPVQ